MREAVLSRPYFFYFLFFFFLYLIFDIWVNEIHVTYHVLIQNLGYGIFLSSLMILIAGFVGLNINLMIMKFKELKKVNSGASGITTLGIFLGILGGACPGCIAGLFPAVLGIFGASAAPLDILPFNGLELQVASLILLVISAKLLSKPAVCKI